MGVPLSLPVHEDIVLSFCVSTLKLIFHMAVEVVHLLLLKHGTL